MGARGVGCVRRSGATRGVTSRLRGPLRAVECFATAPSFGCLKLKEFILLTTRFFKHVISKPSVICLGKRFVRISTRDGTPAPFFNPFSSVTLPSAVHYLQAHHILGA